MTPVFWLLYINLSIESNINLSIESNFHIEDISIRFVVSLNYGSILDICFLFTFARQRSTKQEALHLIRLTPLYAHVETRDEKILTKDYHVTNNGECIKSVCI